MILTMVRGTVVSSNKVEKLVGSKLLIVEEWDPFSGKGTGKVNVAVDLVGSGIGELVLCTCGYSSEETERTAGKPVDMAIVGIVDKAVTDGGNIYSK